MQELTLGRLTLNRRAHRWLVHETNHRCARLATPVHKDCAAAALLCGRAAAAATVLLRLNIVLLAAGPALRGSSQAPPPSSCDLLRPGLL